MQIKFTKLKEEDSELSQKLEHEVNGNIDSFSNDLDQKMNKMRNNMTEKFSELDTKLDDTRNELVGQLKK